MKPLTLELQSFGSYADQASIDFTKPQQNLFLITGNTGSGKSTIFDAMVFALYGEASANRDKKEGVVLQSQFASAGQEPKVTFTFQDKGEEYTVIRIPKHYRKAKRRSKNGNDLVLEPGSVELILPDGNVYAERDVQSRIEAVVGLTKSQFMQVAMIAQGEFMDLLRADTKSKLEIFRKLFHTEVYRDITEELKRRKDAKASEMAKLRTQCLAQLEHVQLFVESLGAKPDGIDQMEEDVKNQLLSAESEQEAMVQYAQTYQQYNEQLQTSLAVLPDFITFLEEMCEFQRQSYDTTRAQWEQVNSRYEEQMKMLSSAQYISRAYEEQEQAKHLLRELKGQEEIQSEKQRQVMLGQKTYALLSFYQDKMDSQNRLTAYQEELEQETKEWNQCQQNREVVQKQKAELEPEWKKQSECYIAVMEQVNRALANFQNGKKKQQEYILQKRELDRLIAEQAALESQVAALEKQCQKEQEELQQLAEAKVAVEKWQRQYEKASSLTQKYQQYHSMEQQLKEQKLKCSQEEKEYEEAKRSYQETQKKYEHLQQSFLDNQAGILARQLEEGKPCPVCGSLSHPDIFEADETFIPTEQEVNCAKQAREEAAKKQMDKAAKVSGTRSAYEQMLEQITAFSKKEFEMDYEDSEEYSANIQKLTYEQAKAEQQYKKEWEQSGEQVKHLQQLAKAYAKREEQLKTEQEKKEAFALKVQEKHTELAQQKAALEELKKQIPYESEAQAQQKADFAKHDYEQIKAQYDAIEKEAESVNAKWEALTARMKKVSELIETEKQALVKKTELYESERAKCNLSEEDFTNTKNRYSREDISRLEQEVAAYKQAYEEAQKTIMRTTEAINGQPKPELARLQEQLAVSEQLRVQFEERKTKKYHCVQNNEQVLQSLVEKMQNRQETHTELARIERLYQVASGQVKGQNKMDIETFVQRYYLKRALTAANQRFVKMSAGQFELTMKQVEDSGNARNEGLDLMVHSLVTDTYRDIKTLSGGESFMAALSLALGMADMIQNASSAIRLDMMFIDEGFGSLDEESRNQAVRILKELAGGQRLIGIISHVSELKQQIEDKLVVTKDNQGSKVKWES